MAKTYTMHEAMAENPAFGATRVGKVARRTPATLPLDQNAHADSVQSACACRTQWFNQILQGTFLSHASVRILPR